LSNKSWGRLLRRGAFALVFDTLFLSKRGRLHSLRIFILVLLFASSTAHPPLRPVSTHALDKHGNESRRRRVEALSHPNPKNRTGRPPRDYKCEGREKCRKERYQGTEASLPFFVFVVGFWKALFLVLIAVSFCCCRPFRPPKAGVGVKKGKAVSFCRLLCLHLFLCYLVCLLLLHVSLCLVLWSSCERVYRICRNFTSLGFMFFCLECSVL
jgi:hypothetical protein